MATGSIPISSNVLINQFTTSSDLTNTIHFVSGGERHLLIISSSSGGQSGVFIARTTSGGNASVAEVGSLASNLTITGGSYELTVTKISTGALSIVDIILAGSNFVY